jgi:hypothetical protein
MRTLRDLWAAPVSAFVLAIGVAPSLPAQAHPPAGHSAVVDTTRYRVTNHGRPAGEMIAVRTGDTLEVRYGHVDRNRGRWVFNRYELVAGEIVAGVGGPMTRDWVPEPFQERFAVASAPGEGEEGDDAFSLRRFQTPFEVARVARTLLAMPGGAWPSPEGPVLRAEVVADLRVPLGDRGNEPVRLVMIHRDAAVPTGVWLDESGVFFASEVGWFITSRLGAQSALVSLREAETAFRNHQAEELARRLAPDPGEVLVLRGGDVFDSETGVVLPRHTVIVRGDRIIAVGPDDALETPEGARTLDVRGRTVLPGLWDMHSHSGLTSQNAGAPMQLAHGLTTVRDLAADLDVAVALRDRAEAGEVLSPRQLLGGFIEGPGLWAGPTEVLVRTEEEARAWVARYDSLGYRQIKLYNLVHPDLLPAIADESRARGLLLSGHVLRGMSVEAAVSLGYDEINHAAFLFSNFFPDSLFVPEMRPYSGVAAAVAPTFDVEGPEMGTLVEFLARRGTVVDGTFNLWMGGRALLEGDEDPGARAYLRLLRRLYEAGVTLVPGTDNSSGSTYRTELELYELAGIPAPEVLRLATLVSARVMGDDALYGSVTPGKVADLVVVDGSPHERIADLEHIDWVVRAGRVYDPDAIRRALGWDR